MMSIWKLSALVLLTYVSYVKGQGLCNSIQTLGNIGYRFHPNECNEFIQCHNDTLTGNTYAVYMACPYGQHWNQVNKRCDDILRGTCSLGICTSTSRIEDGGCRAFTECTLNNRHSHTCCNVGFRYMGGRCMPDYTCTDPCPATCTSAEVCRSYPHWGNARFYYHFHPEIQGFPVIPEETFRRVCPLGSHYDMLECGCVAHRGSCQPQRFLTFEIPTEIISSNGIWSTSGALQIFGGQARFDLAQGTTITGNFNLPMPSIESPLVFKMRFTYVRSAVAQTLFLSNDCKGCSQLKASLVNNQFQVTLSKYNRDVAQIAMSMDGFGDVVDAAVVYNGREILTVIRSNNLHYMKRTQAPMLTVMDCGMQISERDNSFRGRLESISVYSCHYGGRVQDLFDLP